MDIAARVKDLGLPKGSYAVFGSGPLAAHGIREANDLDIVITPELFEELAKSEEWKEDKLRDLHRVLTKEGVELFDTWAPGSWDVYHLIKDAEVVDGVPYVRLESVIEWKMLRNSDKDKRDLELIKEYQERRA